MTSFKGMYVFTFGCKHTSLFEQRNSNYTGLFMSVTVVTPVFYECSYNYGHHREVTLRTQFK